MKIIKAVCVGAGNRGCIYSDFALSRPDLMKLVAVVDPHEGRRNELAERHGIPEDMRFASVYEFTKRAPKCDLVINATMDEIHFEVGMPIIEAGYDMLIEKPVSADPDELLTLYARAKELGRRVFVCHVLRYTPFYKAIKERIVRGDIGKIVSINMYEHVGVAHFLESYVVGKWRSERECGSPFLLAKSCHDLDIMCWLNSETVPDAVASFANRALFVSANAPQGASDACHTCKCEDTCMYSLTNIFKNLRQLWRRMSLDIGKPMSEITQEDIDAHLKVSNYGKCVYTDRDLVDRQNMIVNFKNGSVGSFALVGAVAKANRGIHIVGELGEIFGTHADQSFTVRIRDFKNKRNVEEVVTTHADPKDVHGGGDAGIMTELCEYLNGDRSSHSITTLENSVYSHLVVYAAEKSRKEGVVVNLHEEYKS